MKRITDLPIGTKVEVESMWHDKRLHGVVAEPPEWGTQPNGGGFIPVLTEEEKDEGVRFYAPHSIFVEDPRQAAREVAQRALSYGSPFLYEDDVTDLFEALGMEV